MKYDTDGRLTKSHEKALYSQMLRECPAGYVHSILLDMQPEVERAIDSDFGFVCFAEHEREKERERVDMRAACMKLDEIKSQIRDLETRRGILENGVNELRSTVRKFSQF